MTRKLTKDEVETLAEQINNYYDKNIDDIVVTIYDNVVTEEHIKSSTERMDLSKELVSNKAVIVKLIQTYTVLYVDNFKGLRGDRMASLAIGWMSHISKFITSNTEESNFLIPVCGEKYLLQDKSAVMHSYADNIANHIHGFIIKSKPSKLSNIHHANSTADSDTSLLAFGGACMRLICMSEKKKEETDVKQLISNLTLTKSQRNLYVEWKIIRSNNLASLYTIPVPALVPYLRYLNLAIQENCTNKALALHKSRFIKVS